MTAEREAMTERQAFEKWVLDSREVPANFNRTPSGYSDWVTESVWAAWQAAIAHLSRAAEPVAWTRTDTINDANGCPIGMDEPRIHWGRYYPDGDCGWSPLYARPPEPADAKCKWSQDVDGNWETDCGNLHILIDGTPHDNEMGFCCYCGHAIDQVLYHDAAMAQESGDAT